MNKIQPVILCGGVGSRLWPLSRNNYPKQFIEFGDKDTLFQQSFNRLEQLTYPNAEKKNILIVSNKEHRFLIADQLNKLNKQNSYTLILEPASKNTAPALTLAALNGASKNEDPILIVSPADQLIKDTPAFNKAVVKAIEQAILGKIVIFGVPPTTPETGYGYIKAKDFSHEEIFFKVESFSEKPNQDKAQQYIEQNDYFWNSGIFVLRASVWLDAIRHFDSKTLDIVAKSYKNAIYSNELIKPASKLFDSLYPNSIDYAVIEKCPNTQFDLSMIVLNAGWSDLGSWQSIWKNSHKDKDNNVLEGDVVVEKVKGSFIYSKNRLVACMGLEDILIVDTPDALLVTKKSLSQDLKLLISNINQSKHNALIEHRKVYRPWGWYDLLDIGPYFKVKRILVNPHSSLSLQKHEKRAEHWVVVTGEAEVTCGNSIIKLKQNQSTYIPIGTIHRLSNPFDSSLEIIEIQTGLYLEEDDILRFEDDYGRLNQSEGNL
jgi:mannose-1-phosphate guanylyltransferase/mannose-6-phosphate isomerase